MGVVDRPIGADHVVHAHSPGDVLSSCICRVNRFHFLDELCWNDFCIADFDFWERDEAVPAKSSVKKIEIADRFTLGLLRLVWGLPRGEVHFWQLFSAMNHSRFK